MQLIETPITIPVSLGEPDLIDRIAAALRFRLAADEVPVRFAVTSVEGDRLHCEVGCISDVPDEYAEDRFAIFDFQKRSYDAGGGFNVAHIVPTGIGAEIGGHAGDATPVSQLLASCCDRLITHPNVVNASDINELPDNALYVEGSVLSRLLMGTVGLNPVRANRVMVVFDAQPDAMIENLIVNTVEAARATFGFNCSGLYKLDPALELEAEYAGSGRAVGRGRGIERLFGLIEARRGEFDALAISSLIGVPAGFHDKYFKSDGDMINPWGGIEAMLTHAVSHCFNTPSAHAPMLESREILNEDPGRVDPRMAAEAISSSFLTCVLKGLHRSPRIISDPTDWTDGNVLTARDISCLVIPEGCIGLPTLAALEQGLTVIAVREGSGLKAAEISSLPWAPGQLYVAENYIEAAGMLSALRAGITLDSVRRPLKKLDTITWSPVDQAAPTDRRHQGS